MVVPINITEQKEPKHLVTEMRVKEKTHPPNGSGISTSVSPPKKTILGQVSVIDVESNAEVLDLSKPGTVKLRNGSVGTTETDAIHRRLSNSDSGVGILAHSILESIERTSPGRKRKASPVKKEAASPSKKLNESDAITPTAFDQNLSGNEQSDLKTSVKSEKACDQESTDRTVINSNSENNKVLQEEKQTFSNDQVKANGSLNRSSGEHHASSTTKGKKKVAVGKKAGGKKNVKKKSKIAFQKDDGDFEIDPRLGGSKIKDAVNKKGKDKKLKTDSNDSKKTRVGEQRFPYIHIEGSWNTPQVVKIVNGHLKEDESEGKAVAKLTRAAQYVDEEHRNRAAKVGFTSTLSDRYDSHNRDVTWICVFCQQYTHMQCLGDLYGPYFVNQVSAEPIWFSRKNPDSLETSTSSANTGTGKKAKKSPKKKVVVKTEPTTPISTPTPTPTVPAIAEAPSGIVALHPLKTDGIESSTTEERREVWFHESCVIWAPGVYLVPPRLLGLDEAIADSQQAICEHCKNLGAHIFCRTRGCGLRSHFPCAASNGWLLKEEDFLALCPAHKNQHQQQEPAIG